MSGSSKALIKPVAAVTEAVDVHTAATEAVDVHTVATEAMTLAPHDGRLSSQSRDGNRRESCNQEMERQIDVARKLGVATT